MSGLLALARARRTAGHGVLPPNPSNRAGGHARSAATATRATASASPRLRVESSGARSASAAGHGVLPSNSVGTAQAARPIRRPAPRPGLVQRTLLGGTALGLGLTVRPPVAAGHGVLPPLSGRAG
jgi:hypothetical protein